MLARRLSNAEYDHTVRDLTGVDIRPTREFPVDPANEAGFDNSAESLTMSPALVKKYLEAARRVADHLVLKPDGFAFAPHPVVADTDRDKYCVRRIIDFYQRQRTDLRRLLPRRLAVPPPRGPRHARTRRSPTSPPRPGSARSISATIWATLTASRPRRSARSPRSRPCGGNSRRPKAPRAATARAGCERMRDFVVELRRQLTPEVKNLTAPGIQNGSQSLVLWKNRQYRREPEALRRRGVADPARRA